MSESIRRDSPEERLVLRVAEEYRQKGYEVVLQPGLSFLPDFLRGYQPDLLARRDDESVVVEVEVGAAPSQQAQLRELARAVEGHPGWRFELVVANAPPVPEPEVPTGERPSLTGSDAVQVIADAEDLAASRRPEAALLLAWSAIEAALRLLASTEGVSSPRRQDPVYLLKQLALEGEVPRDDYEVLMRSFRARNAVAHGFRPEEGPELEDLVRKLLAATARLIRLLPDTQPA